MSSDRASPPLMDALQSELERALAYCQAGRFGEAEDLYRTITREHPQAPDGWNMLAVVLYQRGALDEAAGAAQRATELRPAAPPYWLMRGNIALARHRSGEAEESFRRAIAIDPKFAEAHYRLGLAFHSEMRCDEAARAYRTALRFAPDIAEIHWQLAEALLGESRPEEAMRAYQNAFARDPEDILDRRGCFDVLSGLIFDSLPLFWHRELERFFLRRDIDPKPYVRAGLKALKTKPAFRAVLQHAETGAPLVREPDFAEAAVDRLFQALLRGCLMADRQFERFLTSVRAELLLDEGTRAAVPVEFLCALALQNFNNEFVHARSDAETVRLGILLVETEARLQDGAPIDELGLKSLLVLACYRRLEDVRGIDVLLTDKSAPPDLTTLLSRSVVDIRTERKLRSEIRSLGETTDPMSRSVRGMYEEHPYPRWFMVDRDPPCSLAEWVQRELPAAFPVTAPAAPRILVAGCGTGRDALWLATHIAKSRVLGVDLSLTSLAYARRMATEMDVTNVEFRQGDILGLGALEQRFDLIASTGVLHHMREPAAGLRSIAGLLQPGGLMKLGFYSRRARASVTAARQIIAAEGLAATEPEIRRFRQRVFHVPEDSPLKVLEYSNDFYSMSMCRDLIFHVQEHQYTLPEIEKMLRALDLELLGLSELPQETLARYRRMFPADARMIDIAGWDAYEQRYPDTFSRMFLFWCRKR